MSTLPGHVATVVCNSEDCSDYVQVIAESAHQARYQAEQMAHGDGWFSYQGTNGGTFHRCPMHRAEKDPQSE